MPEGTCWADQAAATREACTAQSTAEESGEDGTAAGKAACVTMAEACLTCPAGCQAAIDTYYKDCDGIEGWDATKADTKTAVERLNCDGAATSAPVLFVIAAAVSLDNPLPADGAPCGSARAVRLTRCGALTGCQPPPQLRESDILEALDPATS